MPNRRNLAIGLATRKAAVRRAHPKSRLDELAFTWHGHYTFQLATSGGTKILIDPSTLSTLTACPNIDLVMVTHGHSDHMDLLSTNPATQNSPLVVAVFELASWLSRQGFSTMPLNFGRSRHFHDVCYTCVSAQHSGGIETNDGIIYGAASGFVIEVQYGPTVYISGDTSAFTDMTLIQRVYNPDYSIIAINTPRDTAESIRLLAPSLVLALTVSSSSGHITTQKELLNELDPAARSRTFFPDIDKEYQLPSTDYR